MWVENSFWLNGAIVALVELLILYQWFKYALYDDWPVRRALLPQMDKFPWSAFASTAFVAFCAALFLFAYAFSWAWQAFLSSQMPPARDLYYFGAPMPWIAYIPGEAIAAVRVMALALAFGSFMLFLPARAANLSWGPLTAFRKAVDLRSRLIAVALLWGFMSLVGAIAAQRLAIYIQLKIYPNGPTETITHIAFGVAGGALGAVIKFVAYYFLAYALTRLFVSRTGWRPEPLPVPLTLG